MHDGKVSTTKMMAWITWALSGIFTLACAAVNGVRGGTTTGGMVLCTIAIILAAAAATIHTRSFFCSFASRVQCAYDMGVDRGRLQAMEEGAVPLQRVR